MLTILLTAMLLDQFARATVRTYPKVGERYPALADTYYGRVTPPETAVANQIAEFGTDPAVLTGLTVSVRSMLERAFARHLVIEFGQDAPERPRDERVSIGDRMYAVNRLPGFSFQIVDVTTRTMMINWLMLDGKSAVPCERALDVAPASLFMNVNLGRSPGVPVLARVISRDADEADLVKLGFEMTARDEYLTRARRYFNRRPDREFNVDAHFMARARRSREE